MENTRKSSMKILSFMFSLLILYSSAQPAVLPMIKTENITASAADSEKLVIDLQSVTTSGSTNAYVIVSFGNEYSDLTRIADAGVKVNGNKLNYNSSYSYISYANSGDCIVSGKTIQFYTSSLSEGENTVTFTNPDGGENVSVRLNMSKSGDDWSGYSYTVDILSDDTQETDGEAETGFMIDLKTIAADTSTSAYTVATFGNEYSDLTRIASAGILVNGTKLNYNSSYSSLYYVNAGDCIVTGNTIQFHSSLLIEGENTVTFSNPDGGENKIVRLKMSKVEVPPKYWYESTSYDYVIDVIEDEPHFTVTWKNGDTIIETDSDAETGSLPSFDGITPVKDADDNYTYTFAGWSTTENGDALAELPAVTADVTYYAVFTKSEKSQTEQQLYVRLVGSFEHKIVGQEDDIDAVSSATTGGASYFGSSSSAHVEYAFADKGTALENVPEDAWNKPDYFKNGNLLQVNSAASKIIISPECEGIYGEINQFSGDLFLRGVPKQSGKFKVYVYLDTDKGSATSNSLEFEVYTGNEKLTDQLTYENCTQTADGKYMYDSKPWYMQEFGGENETVIVPKDIKAWYGSHAALPEANYSEIGRTISLTNGEEPSQTLIIPTGCNLTMVNMRVHSGVKIIVEDGAKLTLRQTTVEGIIEVQNGGTFSMDYNDYGGGEWLHGSSINGQLQMKNGSVLENARITCHANYSARDDENRRNFAPLVTTEGNVIIKGDVYILGEEAPTGETAQTALKVNGTLTVSEGSVLACYGGGTSFLTADGGDAIQLDNGTITGAGSVIAIGGYGMSISGDAGKGSGGAAVIGNGKIAVTNAYLEGGSSYHDAASPIYGTVKIADTTNRKLVTGKGNTTEKSEFYWFGTGDVNGIVPQIEKTLAQIPQNAPAGVSLGKTSVKVTIDWTDGEEKHAEDSVTAYVKDNSGKTVKTAVISALNNWSVEINGLDAEKSYTVEADGFADNYTATIAKSENTAGDAWKAVEFGAIEENETYLITYEDGDKTYMLGAQDGVLGTSEWTGQTPDVLPDGYKWIPVKSSSSYYGQWYLMNQDGNKNTYLGMKQNGLDVIPYLYTKDSSTYYTLFADDDGSLWNKYLGYHFLIKDGSLTTSTSEFSKFTFYKKVASNADEFTVSAVSYTKTEAKTPTHQETGNVEYYIGSDGKYYLSNGEDYVEVSKEETEIAALPCKVTITSATGGSIRVLAEYDDENGGRQIYSGAEVPYGTKLTVIREVNTGFILANGKTYETETLTVGDDIEISLNAVKKTYQLAVTAENGSYTTNAADVTAVPYGTKITLTAGEAKNGYEFIGWYQTNGKQISANKEYTVTITSDYAIEARYQAISDVVNFVANHAVVKTVTVEAGSFTDSKFPAAPTPYYGYEFSKWNMTSAEINTALENGDNINVEAVFAPIKQNFAVTVYNGEKTAPETIVCTESTKITRTAKAVEGKNFAYWTLNGEIFSYNRKVSYTAIKDGTLKAVYTAEETTAKGTATLRTASYHADTKKLAINAYLTVPDNCVIKNAGLVASASADNLIWGKAQFNKSLASAKNKCVPVNYMWTKSSVSIGDVWYARAYVSYTDSEGNFHEVYGDIMTFTAGSDYDSSEKGTASIRTAEYHASTKKATFNAYLTVPENGVIVKAGLVAASGSSASYKPDTDVLTSENADYIKSLTSAEGKSAPVNYTWTKRNVNSGDVWYVRAYLVYTLDGIEHTVYGNLTTLTAE